MFLGNTRLTRFTSTLVIVFAAAAMVFAPIAMAQLTGTKTIGGTSPDYATIKAALQDLTAQGTSAPGVTFLIRSGTYNEDTLIVRTSTSGASAPITIKPDAGATVTINVAAGFAAAMKIDSTRYVTVDGSNNGTTTRDMTINALNTAAQDGIWVSGQSYFTTIKNVNIRCNNLSAARGIAFVYTSALGGNPNNSTVDNNRIAYTYRAIYAEGNTSTDLINDLAIKNNIIDSSAFAGVYVWYVTRTSVFNNDVNGAAGFSGTKYGIYVGSTTLNARVYNNKVHDLNQLSTTLVTYGIYSSGTSTLAGHCFFNNFVWGINAPDAGTGAIYGIYNGTGNTTIADTIAFNTVNLTGTSTGNRTTAAFFKGSSTGPAFVRDNVFQNTRTDGTTGVAVAIYKTTALTVVNSNNNNLYVGTPDALHQTGRIATTNYAAIGDWRTANASDANSVAENSPFVSATDLRIQTTVPTQLESGGVPVAGISTDIDGNTRNATTPDIGGDEFTGIIADLSPPVISYIPLGHTSSTSSRTLTATITDASGVPTTGIGLPQIYWKNNSGAYTGVAGTFVSGNQYSFTFGSGVVAGDTVSYFMAAQDSASTPNVGVSPSTGAGGFTANPPAASTPPTSPSVYLITPAPLSGDYTVGISVFNRATGLSIQLKRFTRRVMRDIEVRSDDEAAGAPKHDRAPVILSSVPSRTVRMEVEEDYWALVQNGNIYEGPQVFHPKSEGDNYLAVYATLTAAVGDLNLRGVSGAVRFLLVDTSYTEATTMTIAIANVAQPSATNTVTIKPATGVVTILRTTSTSPVFVVNSNYIIFDGANTNGGSTRNMTISNSGTAASSGVAYVTGSNVTFKNLIGMANLPTQGYDIVYNAAKNGRVENCKLLKATIGIQAQSNCDTIVVVNNDIGGTSADTTTYVQNIGISMLSTMNYTVSGNRVVGIHRPSTSYVTGVLIGWQGGAFVSPEPGVISGNTIRDVRMTGFNAAAYAAYGIYLGSNSATSNVLVLNNMISDIFSESDGSTTGVDYTPHGIIVIQGGGYKIYSNSVNLFGALTDPDAGAVRSGALTIKAGAAVGSLDIRNNILSNSQTLVVPGAVKKSYAIYCGLTNTIFTNINYQDYYSTGIDAAFGYLGSDRLDLTAWRTASGQDANSISGNPNFLDASSNLHINSIAPSPVDSAATPIATVTTDFDGQTRNATRPDIGADEFSVGGPAPIGILSIARNIRVPNAGDSLIVTARIIDSTGVGITADSLLYSVNGSAAVKLAMPRTSGTNTDGTYRGVIPGSANANGNRVEYQIFAASGSGGSVATAIVGANSYFAGISPLSLTGVRAMSASRQLLYANYYCRVTGTVNGPNFTVLSGRINYTFQDAVGGMAVSRSATTLALNVGDSIIVSGVLGQFRGTTQLTPDSVNHITVVATGRTVPVTEVTVNAYNTNPEAYESRLIKETNLQRIRSTPVWGNNVSIPVYQSVVSDSTLLFLDADTPVPAGPEPTYPITVTGIGGQYSTSSSLYNNGYEIIPRSSADLVTYIAPLAESWTDHVTSTMRATVTNEGNIGSLNSFVGTGPGNGFMFNPISTQRLYEGSIMLALDTLRVSDAARNSANPEVFDADFKFLSNLDSSASSGIRRVITASYTDSLAETPFGVRVNQRTVSYDTVGLNNILLVELDLVNTSAASWSTLYAGGFFDWDVNSAGTDRGSVIVDSMNTIPGVNGGNPFPFDMMELHQSASTNSWMGIVPLHENRFKGRRVAISTSEVYPPRMTNGDKWRYMTTNRATNPNGDAGAGADLAQIFGTGPYTVAASGTKRVGYALVGGTSFENCVAAGRAAQRAWVERLGNSINVITVGVQDETAGLPLTFELAQNYPNPFNPSTTIRYALPEAARVNLSIYNLLGQRVAELTNDVEGAGFYNAVWNGRNAAGAQIASGVYFYRIVATPVSRGVPFTSLKKMLLLK